MGPEFTAQILQAFDDGQKMAYRSLWNVYMSFLMEHRVVMTVILAIIYTAAIVRALSGHWGMLGSVLYHSLFFGIFFAVGIIWGPEVFASNYIKVGLVLLYIVCFLMVGKILDWTGLRRRY